MSEVQYYNPNSEVSKDRRVGRLGRIACGVVSFIYGATGVGAVVATVATKMPETIMPAGVGAASFAIAALASYVAATGESPVSGEVNR